MLVCDMCDKGYHTFCLKPVMTSIPKNGWKCKVSTNENCHLHFWAVTAYHRTMVLNWKSVDGNVVFR